MDIVNFPNGFRPQGADFLKRQENAAADFARLRVSAGRGVAQGLTLTRQADGAVVLSGGHGNDALGNAIVVRLAETLDLSSAGLPSAGKYRWIAVVLQYEQLDQGQAAGVGDVWAERLDSYRVEFVLGDEASKERDALRPQNDGAGLLVGDILFDDNGTRSADSARADQGLKRRLEALGSQEWRAFCDYPLGNICLHEGRLYLCTRGHTSGQANAPGKSGAPWDKLASDESIAAAIAKAEANAKSDASSKNDSLESSLKRLISQAESRAKSDASSKDSSTLSSAQAYARSMRDQAVKQATGFDILWQGKLVSNWGGASVSLSRNANNYRFLHVQCAWVSKYDEVSSGKTIVVDRRSILDQRWCGENQGGNEYISVYVAGSVLHTKAAASEDWIFGVIGYK